MHKQDKPPIISAVHKGKLQEIIMKKMINWNETHIKRLAALD